MNEQIVITKNNYGIELIVNFIDNKKKKVDITGCTVEVNFVNPNKEVNETVQAHIISYTNGECSIILDKELTNIEGLWTAYFNAIQDDTGYVTAQEAIYYFVLPENGGAK